MPGTILIAAGQAGIGEAIKSALVTLGHVVVDARTAQHAAITVRTTELDVVVTDAQTAIELAAEIHPDTELIIIGDRKALPDRKIFGFVDRPFELQQVTTCVCRAIEGRQQRAALALIAACRRLLDAQEPQHLPRMIVDVAKDAMAADFVSLLLPTDAHDSLYIAHSTNLVTAVAHATRIALGEGAIGRVAMDRGPAIVTEDLQLAALTGHARIGSSIVYRLATGSQLSGVIVVSRADGERPYGPPDLDLIALLAWRITLALENARLVRQLVVSERLASVGQLAAGVAHEINNPVSYVLSSQTHLAEQLAILDGLGQLISSGADGAAIRAAYDRAGGAALVAQLREAAEDIRGGGVRIRDIVRDIWSLARADDTAIGVDLNEAIRSAIRVAASQVKHRAEIVEDLGEDVWTRGNLGRISQVFVNLLVNAAEAFERGGSNRITITSRRTAGTVVARVADNGPGIRPDQLGRVFDAFLSSVGGTGLGLAMSREIVRSYGGDIQVDSKVAQGAAFTIVLPYTGPTHVAVGVRAIEPSQAMPRSTRILFVDDEPSIRRGYERTFGRSYETSIAVDGEDAWRIITESQKFDIIICDLLMPNTGGMALYHRVCEVYPALAEAFVFVTGGVSEPHVQEFLKACGRTMLEKPFDMKELKRLIEARRPSHRARISS